MLQDYGAQDDDNWIITDIIARPLSTTLSIRDVCGEHLPPRNIYVLFAIRILSRDTPMEGGLSCDAFNPPCGGKWMFDSRHIGCNLANHDLIISSCVRYCD